MMGWDEGFLQQAVDNCTNSSGMVEDCPLFKLQTEEQADQCGIPVPNHIEAEDVQGPGLTSLPGNLPILQGTATMD